MISNPPFIGSTLTSKVPPDVLVLTSLTVRNSSRPLSWNLAPCTISVLVPDPSLQARQARILQGCSNLTVHQNCRGKLLGKSIAPGGMAGKSGSVSPLGYSGIRNLESYWEWSLEVASLGNHVSDISLWVRILLPSLTSCSPLGKSFSLFVISNCDKSSIHFTGLLWGLNGHSRRSS